MHPRHFVRWVGHKLNQQGFEIQQQRIWCGVVGAQGFAIKAGGVVRRQCKQTAVQHHVTLNFANAHALQATQQQPKLLHAQLRVATALQVHLPVPDITTQLPVQIHRRAPCEGRPQQIQRCTGGDQLHEGRWIAGHLGHVLQTGSAGCAHGQHHHTQCVAWQFGALQRVFDGGRQAALPMCCAQQAKDQHDAANQTCGHV